ncbi:MAG: hypothetical protein P8182_11195, partial [Deltaproteobacteria bacterium]
MSIEKAINLKGLLRAVFFISFAAIGWQPGLMRALLISRYHHFSFLVISCALLGIGVGGTLLSVTDVWFERHRDRVFRGIFSAVPYRFPPYFVSANSFRSTSNSHRQPSFRRWGAGSFSGS